MRILPLVVLAAVLCSCPTKKPLPEPEKSGRCEVDLAATGLFSQVGNGVRAKVIETVDERVGGPFSQGVLGDYLLENEKIRVVVQRPYRHIGAAPYGGTIIDADLKRPAGQPPRDQLGKMTVLYAFGRTINTKKVEVLQDGSAGGAAVIAATGIDAVNDYVNVPNMIGSFLPGSKLVVDPNQSLPITATTYYVLSPGESRVRVLTAFCNSGSANIFVGMGDLVEQGGVSEFFNPSSCKNGMGAKGCTADPSPWYGFQAEELAYAVRTYKFADPKTPEPSNALLYVSGVVGVLAGGEGLSGILSWVDADATRRPGVFGIPAGAQRTYLRDLFLGRDLGETLSQMEAIDAASRARLDVSVTQLDDGAPAAFVRVAVLDAAAKQKTVLVTNSEGKAKVDLPSGNYTVVAGEKGHQILSPTAVTVPTSGQVSAALSLGLSRTLTVTVKEEPAMTPVSSKVTVRCPLGPCSTQIAHYRPFFDVDDTPSNLAAIGYVPASGTLTLRLPPGIYEVFVTRGPEYSAYPDTFPSRGVPVDLTSAPGQVDATLARVVDTQGWMSADLHVHAVASADSSVANAARVASFAAEGVDVLVSTDHDYVTDFAPLIAELGLQEQMTSMIGCEVTPFDYGHQNAYPISLGEGPTHGAFDWAGGDGASLRLDELYAGLKTAHPNVVIQMNHPRGTLGSLTQLKVDTATGASHEKPEAFRMTPHPSATEFDTKLLSNNFDAIEVQNGIEPHLGVMNDWMTFLSRGLVKTSTGVSDSHNLTSDVGGYGRTWVRLGVDLPAQFDPAKFSQAMKAQRATSSSGQFITLTAQKVAAGVPAGPVALIGDTLSLDPTAGETVELTVDVQAPEWMDFTAIEIYTHTTGREATNGATNREWPDNRRLAFKTYDPAMLPRVAVMNTNARKIHVTEKFRVSPNADTWYVAMVRGGAGSRTLAPMAWHGVKCSNGVCVEDESRPAGFTNAILIDADKSGKYDDFPLKQQLVRLPPPTPAVPRRTPSLEELETAIQAILRHK